MPEIDLDFGSVNKVPEGWFRLSVNKAIFKPNKVGDGYIINLQMQLTDMPDGFLPDTEVPYEQFEGMNVFDNVSMKLSSRWKLAQVLSAITGDEWEQDNMKLQIECTEDCGEDSCPHNKHVPILENQTVIGLIQGEDYQGRLQARVTRYLTDDGSVEFGPDMTE